MDAKATAKDAGQQAKSAAQDAKGKASDTAQSLKEDAQKKAQPAIDQVSIYAFCGNKGGGGLCGFGLGKMVRLVIKEASARCCGSDRARTPCKYLHADNNVTCIEKGWGGGGGGGSQTPDGCFIEDMARSLFYHIGLLLMAHVKSKAPAVERRIPAIRLAA